MKMVKLVSCANDFELQVLRGNLENEGIPCEISNAIMNGYPPMSGEIFVREEDYARAREIVEARDEAVRKDYEEKENAENIVDKESHKISLKRDVFGFGLCFYVAYILIEYIFSLASSNSSATFEDILLVGVPLTMLCVAVNCLCKKMGWGFWRRKKK